MKNKKISLVGGLLLGLGLTVLASRVADKIGEVQKSHRIVDIRDYLSQYGDIQVVYLNEFEKGQDITGGVVMTDGRHFEFCYDNGEIISQEVVA